MGAWGGGGGEAGNEKTVLMMQPKSLQDIIQVFRRVVSVVSMCCW